MFLWMHEGLEIFPEKTRCFAPGRRLGMIGKVRFSPIIPLCLALATATFAADDPFAGTWKLSDVKSKTEQGGARVQALQIESASPEMKIVYKGIDAKGQPVEWKVPADFSGNFIGVIGAPDMDSVRCFRSDERTILLKMSRGGETLGWETLEVAKNGKSLRLTHALTDAKGKETKTVSSFEKQ